MVKDKSDFSLPGASLKLDKYNRYTISDQNGYFEFLNVPSGDYILEVTYIGFKTQQKNVTVSAGKNTVIDLTLEDGAIMGQEIVVMGSMLRGQAKALNQQKTNTNISNIISSDQVGRFPDSNIGDALKRIPGITMQNDQGEARNIIIRGLAPELNSVALNGNRIPSAEGDNRNVQMDLIPSDMISTIEVNKTLTSDMDGDAIGGSVNLITRAAPNKQRISATLLGGYNPIREKYTYSGSFIYGNRFLNNQLGVVVSGSYLDKKYGSDNIEAVWDKADNGKDYVTQFDIRKYDVQRIRRSISSNIDYKINDNNSIAADVIYNWRDDRENRYRTRYRKIEALYDDAGNISGYKGEVRTETKGGIDNNRNKNTRLEDQRVQNYVLRGQHLISEKFDLDWNLSYSRASEDRPNERYISFQQKKLNITEDLSDMRLPLIGATNEDVAKKTLNKLSENHNNTVENEYSAKVNMRVPLSIIDSQKGRLRFGLRARIKDKKRDNIFYTYEPINKISSMADLPLSNYSSKDFEPSKKYILGSFVSKQYLGGLKLNDPSIYNRELAPEEFLAKNYKAKERVLAGYVRWDQNLTNDLLLIVGVRAEHTNIDYDGNEVINDDENSYKTISDKNNYMNLLPSVTMKYDVNQNFVLRGAFTTALARPNYYNLVPYMNINSEENNISTGNSNLKATYSYNFDIMGEYYFKSVGIISGGVFYKRLKNFIYKYRTSNYTSADFAKDFPQSVNPIAEGDEWEFTQQRNGKGVNVFGYEIAIQRKLDFLPTQFLKNFGVYLNYTYTHSKAKGIADEDGNQRNNITLPGTAPHMFNASLSWENQKFSARASLNYTSDYLDALNADKYYDGYYDKQLFLDVNASYKVTSQFKIFAEANNLTNQALRYYQGEKNRVQQLEYYKPTFTFGLKYDF